MMQIPLWKRLIVLMICILGTVYSIPSFLSEKERESLPSWFPSQSVNLGLDLQGGSHLLLEVDLDSAFKDRLNVLAEDTRRTLRQKRIKYSNLKEENDQIRFKIDDPAEKSEALTALRDMSGDVETTVKDDQFIRQYSEGSMVQWRRNVVSQSKEIVERRIDELGTREPNVQVQGTNRIIVQLPGVNDPSQAKQILGTTAKLTFQLVNQDFPTLESSGGRILPGTEAFPLEKSQVAHGKQPVTYLVNKQVLLTGENLVNARVSNDPKTNATEVAISFDAIGAKKFADITKNNIGRQLAIVLDKQVISAPSLNVPIMGGNAVIQGNFTVEEASNLALLMRAGALPAPITVVEERTVGPDLGADSIQAGKKATVVSVIFIVIFMVVLYALFGLFANFALIFNLVFLIAALAVTGSTLTLPGIAGIALTLGMAVDANVLIYERIKEELRHGRKIPIAVEAGYSRAMATIIDSNLTTLIGGLALYFFGTGPIRGFGVTTAIGIVVSMFTSITLTRILAVAWIRWRKPQTLSI
jgi:preprotein translocase subunit SecD